MKKLFSVRSLILAGSLLLQLSTLCFHSQGAAGDVDLSFDPGSGVNGTVNHVVVQPDGKVIIGGWFTTVKGLARPGIARLNADGSGDATFNPDMANTSAIALQPDGKVLVGHSYGITRLNSDGTLDSNFISPSIANGLSTVGVGTIAVQPDGKVLIGGLFTSVNGTNRSGIARLNANGSFDSSFNPGTGANGSVLSLASQADGKLLIGGNFDRVDGTNCNGIARLNANGTLDGSFNRGTVLDSQIGAIVLQPDGKVLVAANHGFIRLNTNGSLDNSFYCPVSVFSIALQLDGGILIGGNFTEVHGTFQSRIARLNANGSLDGSFDPGTGVDGSILSIALQSNGQVFIGGLFIAVNGMNRNRTARLNADGSLDGTFNPGKELDGPYAPLEVQANGKVLIASSYVYVNSTNGNGRVRLNADGSLDSSFIPDTSFNPALGVLDSDYGVESFVGPFVKQSDGKVLLGGHIFLYEEVAPGSYTYWNRYFVARFNADGSRDPGFAPVIGGPDFGLSERVQALAVQTDGKVVVGGTFASGIARLNPNGSSDSSFNPGAGVNGSVLSIALQSDGKVLIGGSFTAVNGTSRNRIARLNGNGNLDTSFDPGTGANNTVFAIVLQPDGKTLIGGDFTTVNGTNRNRIARLNADGSLDSTFNPGTGANGGVFSIALQPDGKVLIGGDFTTVNGLLRPHVARLYGDAVVLPSLNIARSNALAVISWPVTGLNFQLQESTGLSLPNSWSPVAQPAVTNAGQISVTVPTTAGRKFFRLNLQ